VLNRIQFDILLVSPQKGCGRFVGKILGLKNEMEGNIPSGIHAEQEDNCRKARVHLLQMPCLVFMLKDSTGETIGGSK